MHDYGSHKALIFKRHVELMQPALELPEEQSFAITPETGIEFWLLRQLADQFCNKERKIVVLQHSTAFEVRRINSLIDVSLFYKFVKPTQLNDKPGAAENQAVSEMIRIFKWYMSASLDKAVSYYAKTSSEMLRDGVIAKSWLTVRMANNKSVKQVGLDRAVDLCVINGLLTEITGLDYGIHGKIYKISKSRTEEM